MCDCCTTAKWAAEPTCFCTKCHGDLPVAVVLPTVLEWADAHKRLTDYSHDLYRKAERLRAESTRWRRVASSLRAKLHDLAPTEYSGYGARSSDPLTSHLAAEEVKVRAGSHRARLLSVYREGLPLSDAEAASLADMPERSCWWKRCSELRQGGYIEPHGLTIDPETEALVMTCRITDKGREVLDDLSPMRKSSWTF